MYVCLYVCLKRKYVYGYGSDMYVYMYACMQELDAAFAAVAQARCEDIGVAPLANASNLAGVIAAAIVAGAACAVPDSPPAVRLWALQ